MTDGDDSGVELGGDSRELGADERELADRMIRERPLPSAGFRGALGRHLDGIDQGYRPRPESLRTMVAGALASGTVLIAAGLAQAVGAI